MTNAEAVPVADGAVNVEPPVRGPAFLMLKRCLQALFTLCVLPRLAIFHLGRMWLGPRAFSAASESIVDSTWAQERMSRRNSNQRSIHFCLKLGSLNSSPHQPWPK